jgi:hypothetical protein
MMALEEGGFDAADESAAEREIAAGVRPFEQNGRPPTQITRTP